jgi:hypothetical protein
METLNLLVCAEDETESAVKKATAATIVANLIFDCILICFSCLMNLIEKILWL